MTTLRAALAQGARALSEIDGGTRDDGLTSAERDELRRLRKENRQLRTERDILAKAAAWFAQSDVTPCRSSSS